MPATTTAAFLATLGVDTKMSQGTVGYSNTSGVIADLKYLGISNVREGDNGSLSALQTVGKAGIKFDFLLAGGGSMTTSDIQSELNVINQVAAAAPGSVLAVEGANEINNFPITYNGVGGLQGAVNMQQDIYRLAHADASLPGISVYYFTGYGAIGQEGPNPAITPGLADYDTQHPYPWNGNPPLQWVNRAQALDNESPPTGPAVYTETGYSSTNGFGANIGLVGQAKYTLDLLMDTAQIGIARTYLYELYEEGDGLGLFNSTGAPKPAATAIHNLTTILADSGTVPASATAANYSVSGLPSSGHSMALVKSTGATDIIVWAEPQISTTTSGPPNNVTVALGATYGSVKVFDPLQGTSPIQTLTNVSSVGISVTDHPLIIEVQSASTVTPPPPPTTDSLTLRLSEDAYQGDAQFTVSVDGKQVGGTMTASALHSSGDSNVFTLTGSWGAGSHDVKITFLNDAYAGTPTTDRNLYVNSIAYDGTTYAGTTATMLSAGPRDFTVGDGTATTAAPADTLTVLLSEDAWNGNALFSLSIDGKTITTPQQVTASHAAGAWQAVTLSGNFGAGTHKVGVTFLNDAYGGTPATDRNLYVGGVSVNGQSYGSPTAMYSAGTSTYSVTLSG